MIFDGDHEHDFYFEGLRSPRELTFDLTLRPWRLAYAAYRSVLSTEKNLLRPVTSGDLWTPPPFSFTPRFRV